MKPKKRNNKLSERINYQKKYAIIDSNGKVYDTYRLKGTAINIVLRLNHLNQKQENKFEFIGFKPPFKIITISQTNDLNETFKINKN